MNKISTIIIAVLIIVVAIQAQTSKAITGYLYYPGTGNDLIATDTPTFASSNISGTSTASNGFNITKGCFSISNVCIGGGLLATWGTITGTLTSQSDLNTALNGKQATIGATWPIVLTGSTVSFGGISTSTVATTTFTGGIVAKSIGIGTSTFPGQFSVNPGTVNGSTTISMGKIQFDGYNSGGVRVCTFLTAANAWIISAGPCK